VGVVDNILVYTIHISQPVEIGLEWLNIHTYVCIKVTMYLQANTILYVLSESKQLRKKTVFKWS